MIEFAVQIISCTDKGASAGAAARPLTILAWSPGTIMCASAAVVVPAWAPPVESAAVVVAPGQGTVGSAATVVGVVVAVAEKSLARQLTWEGAAVSLSAAVARVIGPMYCTVGTVAVGVLVVGVTAPTDEAVGAEAPPALVAEWPVDCALAGVAQAIQARVIAPSTLIDAFRTETSFVCLRG
jgi:hypothetical protein